MINLLVLLAQPAVHHYNNYWYMLDSFAPVNTAAYTLLFPQIKTINARYCFFFSEL